MENVCKLVLILGFIGISMSVSAQNKEAFECFNNDVIASLKKDSYNKSFNEIKKQEDYQLFFSSKKGRQVMKKLYGYFQELRMGKWTEKGQENIFLLKEEEDKMFITIETIVERNLTSDERKSIKGKVSKSSYKEAKYHHIGKKKCILNFDVIEDEIYIVGIEFINELKIVR